VSFHVVVPAAGSGSRLGGQPKQFRLLIGVPVLVRAIRPFAQDPGFGGVVVAVSESEVDGVADLLKSAFPDKDVTVIVGGETRQESVRKALAAVPGSSELVLIHDAVRPFVSPELVARVAETASARGAACPAIPVSDTLRRVESDEFADTVDRQSVWAVQTPQAFRLAAIRQAHDRAAGDGIFATDDVELYQKYSGQVALVRGDRANFKITDSGDWELEEALASLTDMEE